MTLFMTLNMLLNYGTAYSPVFSLEPQLVQHPNSSSSPIWMSLLESPFDWLSLMKSHSHVPFPDSFFPALLSGPRLAILSVLRLPAILSYALPAAN